jgi:hypothetical protein
MEKELRMNFGDVFATNVTGSSGHATHVGHGDGAAPPPPVADMVDLPSWESAWIDLGGEG